MTRLRLGTVAVVLGLITGAIATGVGASADTSSGTAPASAAQFVFKVRSSIDGETTFGHRVHWVAYPNLRKRRSLLSSS